MIEHNRFWNSGGSRCVNDAKRITVYNTLEASGKRVVVHYRSFTKYLLDIEQSISLNSNGSQFSSEATRGDDKDWHDILNDRPDSVSGILDIEVGIDVAAVDDSKVR